MQGESPEMTAMPALDEGTRSCTCDGDSSRRICRKRTTTPPGEVAVMLDNQAIGLLAQSFRGTLIQPGDDGYDEARKLYNGMIDKRPRLIARCADVADVITAVNFGRDTGSADRDPRRRPQRTGARQLQRRSRDRSVAPQRRARRSRRAHGARRARLHAGRRRSCRARVRARSAGGHRLDDRHRGAHARRRQRLL